MAKKKRRNLIDAHLVESTLVANEPFIEISIGRGVPSVRQDLHYHMRGLSK